MDEYESLACIFGGWDAIDQLSEDNLEDNERMLELSIVSYSRSCHYQLREKFPNACDLFQGRRGLIGCNPPDIDAGELGAQC